MRKRERASRTPVIVVGLIVLALIVAAVYWFAIRDDGDSADGATLSPQEFAMDGVPFTFTYPGDFATAEPPEGVLWVAGVSPVDIIDVKRISDESMGIPQIKRTVGAALDGRSGVTVTGEGTEQVGGREMVRFTVSSSASGKELRSQLYYFPMDGAVWQLECQSQDSARAKIDSACMGMLESLIEH